LTARKMDLSAFLLRLVQAVGVGSRDVVVVEEPMVLMGAPQIVLVGRASYSWEEEQVLSFLQTMVSVRFLNPCIIDEELYLSTNLVSRGPHPHQD
jgi:hypothetical protein